MMHRVLLLLLAMLTSPIEAGDLAHAPSGGRSPLMGAVESFELDNGLRVVVQTDRSSPIVAVTVLYHVGSRHESEGRSGFAHLFEHLMFSGSEHHPQSFASAFAQAGVSRANAATWWDHTIFFETVPTSALEFALYLEAERMGYFATAITQQKLDVERGVVINEMRQKENAPYGRVEEPILKAVFPPGHPYRWSPLGSVRDLQAARLDEVVAWHGEHYTPDNAVLALAGDIDVETARRLVTRYFGSFRAGAPRTELTRWLPRASTTIRVVQDDPRAAAPRVYRAWAGPGLIERDRVNLDVLTTWLGRGNASVLKRVLVDERRLASSVSFDVIPGELASLVLLTVSAKPDADLTEIERVIEAMLADVRAHGPSTQGIAQARIDRAAELVRSMESVGGTPGRSSALALAALYAGDARFVETQRQWIDDARPDALRAVANRVLTPESFWLTVKPAVARTASGQDVPAPQAPVVGEPPPPTFPSVANTTLRNGLKLSVAYRADAPVTVAALMFDAGYASDPPEASGLAEMTAQSLLASGSGFDPSSAASRLGADLAVQTRARESVLRLSAPSASIEAGISLLGELMRRPLLDDQSLEAVRSAAQARAVRASTDAFLEGERTLAAAVFGEEHPFAAMSSGVGNAKAIGALSRETLEAFRARCFAPANATLVVAGNVRLEQLRAIAEKAFAKWAGAVRSPLKTTSADDSSCTRSADIAASVPPQRSRIIIVDRPGAQQTQIVAGLAVPPAPEKPDAAQDVAVAILGERDGSSRLGTNLRARHGWAYWARGYLTSMPGPRMLVLASPVQTDKTAAAMREIQAEVAAYRGASPPSDEEVAARVRRDALRFAARFETTNAVVDQLIDNAALGRGDNYAVEAATAVRAVTPDAVRAAGRALFAGDLVWVLVGDRARITQEVAALGFGPIESAAE